MPAPFPQGFAAYERQSAAQRLDRAIARAEFIVACRRRVLPILTVLGGDQGHARRALEDAEAHADALRRLRDRQTGNHANQAWST